MALIASFFLVFFRFSGQKRDLKNTIESHRRVHRILGLPHSVWHCCERHYRLGLQEYRGDSSPRADPISDRECLPAANTRDWWKDRAVVAERELKVTTRRCKEALESIDGLLSELRRMRLGKGAGGLGGNSRETKRRQVAELVENRFLDAEGDVDHEFMGLFRKNSHIRGFLDTEIDSAAAVELEQAAGLTHRQYDLTAQVTPGVIPPSSAMIATRKEMEATDIPAIYYAAEGAPGVCLNPVEMADLVLSMPNEVADFDLEGENLFILTRGDGATVGEFRKQSFYAEMISFLQQKGHLTPRRTHLIAVVTMTESLAQHDRHLRRVMKLLESLNGTTKEINGKTHKIVMLRFVDGAEMGKNCGTAGFSSHHPCPRCNRHSEKLHLLPWECPCDDTLRDYDDTSCSHEEGCTCNKHNLEKLYEKFPPQRHGGFSPEDVDHPKRTQINKFIQTKLQGCAHTPSNVGTWIGKWCERIFYDPLHLFLNTFKTLWAISSAIHMKLNLNNELAKRLSKKPLDLGMLNVEQDGVTKKEIRQEKLDNVRETTDALIGADRAHILEQTHVYDIDGVQVDSFLVFEPLHEAAVAKKGTYKKAFVVLSRLFKLHATCGQKYLSVNSKNPRALIPEFKAATEEYYSLMASEVGARLLIEGYANFFKWPDHYLACHALDDMKIFIELTGKNIGEGTCQISEHMMSKIKQGTTRRSNAHASVTNIDDNKHKQMLRNHLLQFAKGYSTEKKRTARVLAPCEACVEHGWNLDCDGNPVLHYKNNPKCYNVVHGIYTPSKAKKTKGELAPSPVKFGSAANESTD